MKQRYEKLATNWRKSGDTGSPPKPSTAPLGVPAAPGPDDIRLARQCANMTQEQAAAVIYATRRAWQEWEGGRRAMHPAMWEYWQHKVAERGRRVQT